MKKKLLLILICLLPFISKGQTTLAPGDIVILAINGDIDAANSYGRGFSFMPLVNLEAGTVINFTDYGWSDLNSSFITNTSVADVFIHYTAPSLITAGTVIRCDSYSNSNFTFDYAYSGVGTNNYLNLAGLSQSDELLVFQGTRSSPTFIYAVTYVSTAINSNGWATSVGVNGTDGSGAGSALPPGLTNDLNAISFNQVATANDNSSYSGPTTGTTKAGWITRITNYSNWTFNDAAPIPPPLVGPFGVYALGSVTTITVSSIAATTATGNGNITSLGYPNPTQYGVVWNTSANPDVSLGTKTQEGARSTTGAFTSNITGLQPNTTYHIRAYVTNDEGTAYGSDEMFTTDRLTVIWNGTAWSPSNPTVNDNAIIDGTYNGTGFTCNNLTVNAGKQLTISSGTLTIGGDFMFKSDISKAVGSYINNGTLAITGTIKYERYVPLAVYEYLSSPLATQTTIAFGTISATASTGKRLFTYNNATSAWVPVTNGSSINTMQGYSYKAFDAPITVTFAGPSFNTGDKSFTLAKNATGYNLVGNPYASAIDWSSAANAYWTRTNVNPSIWINYSDAANSASFASYNQVTGIATNWSGNVGTANGIIPPTQAFWVKALVDGTILTVTEAARTHTSNIVNKKSSAVSSPLLRLKTQRSDYTDETVVYFNENATADYDNYDSEKQMGNGAYPQLYSTASNLNLAVNSQPVATLAKEYTLPLLFKSDMAGTCTIKATEILNFAGSQKISLEDKLLNTTVDLRQTSSYSFEVSASASYSDRFVLHFSPGSITAINNKEIQGIQVYSQAKTVYITHPATQYKVELVNTLGVKVLSREIAADGKTSIETQLTSGVYVVVISWNGQQYSKNIFIK